MAHWLLLLLCFALPAKAEEVVLGLSQDRVAITTNFDGSEILIFGAVKREDPIPATELGVIVTVAGPSQNITVRRKEHRMGIWINTDSVVIDSAPSFYAVAASAKLADVLTKTEDLRHKVSIPRAIRSVGAPMNVKDSQKFTQALIRARINDGSYQMLENGVIVDQQTLFRTSISLPSNLTEGDYETRILLTRNGHVVSEFNTFITVNKVGLERWLFNLSRETPLLYGLLSLFIAISSGWGASAVFQLFRS